MFAPPASDDAPRERLVLLGANGFLARCVLREARRVGGDPVALGRPDLDLTRPESVARLGATLHSSDRILFLAGLTPEHGRDAHTRALNLLMFRNAAEALKRRGFSHFTYLSSDAVYAWQSAPITESSRLEPLDAYGEMHAEREQLARALGRETGSPVAILRPAAVHGPGDTHHAYGPNRFIREILLYQRLTLFGQGEEVRAHLWEEDCASWILQAASDRFDGTLNIAPRRAVPFCEVAHLLAALCGTQPKLVHAPRKQEITHRSFDPALRERLWPHLAPLTLEESLRRHWTALARPLSEP